MSDSPLANAENLAQQAARFEAAMRIRTTLGPALIRHRDKDGNVEFAGVLVNARELELLLWDGVEVRKDELKKAMRALDK